VIPFPEPTSPSRLVVGVSPNVGVKRPLIQEAHMPARFKASHKALVAQDDIGAVGYHVEVSPAPSEKAGTARQLASMMVMNLVGQTEMNWCPVKTSVEFRCPMSDGFHGGDSSVTLGRANIDLFNTTRIVLMSIPLIEPLGCPAETSMEIVSDGSRADEPLITMGKADTKGERALKGLVLSNYVLSSLRVGIEDLGVSGGDEGGRVEGASDI